MTKKQLISWLLVILWMVIIFLVSNIPTDASNEVSRGVITAVGADSTKMITTGISLNKLIRKCGHIAEYFILGGLVINGLSQHSLLKKQVLIYSIGICFLYACSDEIHQFFVGRTASILDVIIDMTGALLALIYYLIATINKRKIFMQNKCS